MKPEKELIYKFKNIFIFFILKYFIYLYKDGCQNKKK
jgi:hypothetical protein